MIVLSLTRIANMRELKFRAWDKAYKAMCRTENGGRENLDGWSNSPEIFEVMQYTGLKDKNAVEVFEGDILGFGGMKLVVKDFGWNCGECYGTFGWIFDDKFDAEDIEVIGNIHENPELLA